MPPPAKGKFPGVQARGDEVRIWFSWQGKRCWEPYPAANTPAGLRRAAAARAKIVTEISLGVFDYSRWFPHSDNAVAVPTFGEYAQIWLERSRANLAPATLVGYVKKLNRYWLTVLSHRPITEITAGELRDIGASLTIGAKTYNDSLVPVRQVFEAAIDDQVIAANPAVRLKSRPRQAPPIEPLSPDEQRQILEWMRSRDPHWWPYFAIAFDTGMRTSELLALEWSAVDFNTGYLRVDRAYVRQAVKQTKTARGTRDIELGALARSALGHQRSLTQLVVDESGRNLVFLDKAGKIINDDKPPRLVWTRCLRSLGIRHRPAYNTRHTFATAALMAGVNIGWISKQLGHASIDMTLRKYATWIAKLDKGSERAKLDQAKGQG